MTFTDGLTASAIILAVVAIVSEIVFFIVQTDRASKSQREISEYVGQMRQVLGKIEGLTTSTREQQQEQFKQLLDFALGQQRASIGEELAGKVGAFEKQLASLEAKLSTGGDQEYERVMDELRQEVESLAKDVKALGESAEPQPPPRFPEAPFVDKFLQEAYGRWLQKPDVQPTEGEPET